MENDKSTQYFLVYKHTSPSGKSYVGLTNNLIEEANDWEKFFIKIENTGRKMSEESRAKMSEAQKKRFAKNKINQLSQHDLF